MLKNADEIARNCQETVAALTASCAQFAQGCSEIGRHLSAAMQQATENHLSASRELMNLKSPYDLVEASSKWANNLVEMTGAQAKQFTQLSTKVAQQTCEPLQQHFSALTRKMG